MNESTSAADPTTPNRTFSPTMMLLSATAALLGLACGASSSPPPGEPARDSGAGGTGGGADAETRDSHGSTAIPDAGPGGAAGGAAADASQGPDLGGQVPLDSFANAVTGVLCSRAIECCAAFMGVDPAVCVDELGMNAQSEVERDRPLIAVGRIRYHADRAATCIALLQAATCSAVQTGLSMGQPVFSLCDSVFEPTVSLGQDCVDSNECVDGRCEPTTRRCVPKLGTGGPCQTDDDCTSGDCSASGTCSGASSSGLCPL